MIKVILCLLLAQPCKAAITGKFALDSSPRALLVRDIYNGQWRGGYDKPLYVVNLNDKELLHLGFAHTWNAEHGNSAVGPSIGKVVNIGQVLSLPSDLSGLASFWKPLGYLANVTSLEGYVGYMPLHTPDVKGPLIGGFGVTLNLSDVLSLLQKGL